MSSSSNGPPGNGDREIHRLFDGDLTPDEVAALIEAEKKRDARGISGTRVKLEALGDLRALIRAATSDESEPIDADAAWAQIAARIEGATSAEIETRASAPKIGRPNLRVIEGGLSDKTAGERGRESSAASEPRASEDRPVDRAPERAESAPPGLLQRIDRATADRDEETKRRERQVRQRRTIIMVVSGLAAAAAAAIAFLGPGEEPTPDPIVAVEDGTGGGSEAPIEDVVAAEQLRRTEVISVDFGANAGTVFSVEGTEGSRYAVVWLTDEAEKAADPTATTTNDDETDSPTPGPDDTANL
jgi:hypothetical protein